MFQHQVEIIPRRVEAVIEAKGRTTPYNAHDFRMRLFDQQVSTNF
jgi:hypothetical protein